MKIVSAREAVARIEDGWTIVPGGFGSCGHPDELSLALRERFCTTGSPRRLTYLFAAGPGDKAGHGLDSIALEGLVSRAIGGFWGLSPRLAAMARAGTLEAHNWPQGVISKMFSAIAGGAPGIFSKVGSHTFVDPEQDGGVIDTRGSRPLVRAVELDAGQRWLYYPALPVHCALLRGTAADAAGNISFAEETSYMDALAQAMAARQSGGIVVVQVKHIVDSIPAREVRIPGLLVDFVVEARPGMHPQTYGTAFDAGFAPGANSSINPAPASQPRVSQYKQIIAHRAALELARHPGANINLGIGIPALIGAAAAALGQRNFTLTVESGLIGGVPAEGLSFGASHHPEAVIEQAALFDFYDGGGIDVAFLGFAEIDPAGNVNVSRFAGKMPGSGGFINISQAARKIVFCGSFTTDGLRLSILGGQLRIVQEGRVPKFRTRLEQLTFNAVRAQEQGREIMVITERGVFGLDHEGLILQEIAPGLAPEALLATSEFPFRVSPGLTVMPFPPQA